MTLLEVLQPEQEEVGTMRGVAIGVVTDNKDSENLGQVMVQFPWRNQSREISARLVAAAAGNNRGVYWIPDVGDEVLVIFEKDDPEHPFIIGSLWNGQDKPPANNADGENNTRLIRSRNGHEIRLFDREGQGSVEIKSGNGHRLTIDDQASTVVLSDSGGTNKVTIDINQNSITVQSGLNLTLKSQNITIEAATTMTLKAGSALRVQGTPIMLN